MAMLQANNRLIHRLIDRMGKMTSQLKSFAYQKPEQLCPVSLPDALQETLRIYQAWPMCWEKNSVYDKCWAISSPTRWTQ